MRNYNLIKEGVHYLSGIGTTSMHDGYNNEEVEVNLFIIDNVVYGAHVDPSDGYRSYGEISVINDTDSVMSNIFQFAPQKIIVEYSTKEVHACEENNWTEIDEHLLIIKDAILNKEVLVVGTDYSDSYYPFAIFRYNPMNLYANVERQAKGYIS